MLSKKITLPEEKMFPILISDRATFDIKDKAVPWRLIEPLRGSVLMWHNQTLERIAERGGLGVFEMYAHTKNLMPEMWLKLYPFAGPSKETKEMIKAWFEEWKKSWYQETQTTHPSK